MIDGNSTTLDWQTHTGKIYVWPIGSFEQHGPHLPLDTDITGSEYFARLLAEDLNAALLPAQPLGNCFEHSGFRGSFSLRPETLMQIVRDVAAEAERQHFEVLVLLNGHGGNFTLGPVARDWNRQDRSLKILLVNWWDFAGTYGEQASSGLDLHAGDFETSLMLAIAPQSVRREAIQLPTRSTPSNAELGSKTTNIPLTQTDLNTFGMGQLHISGAVGAAHEASAERGHNIVAEVRAGMLRRVQDRIERLQRNPHYSGAAGIAVRAMTPDDVASGMELKTLAGWNQTVDDWNLMLRHETTNGFVAVQDGRVVGSVVALKYDARGWIGMMLVHPDWRGRGVGRLLMQSAMQSLADCPAIGLDATPAGKPLYAKFGFRDEYSIVRLTHRCVPIIEAEHNAGGVLCPASSEMFSQFVALDSAASGFARPLILKELATHLPTAWALRGDDKISAFGLGRPGSNFYQIGPVVGESTADARSVIAKSLSNLIGRSVVIDVPVRHTAILKWLQSLGFVREREFTRMIHGNDNTHEEIPEPANLFAIAGPEFG
jgi:creatinine amidohydrolase/Fe(II)-dependent formamide hydrolase-like protein/predicted N-acetyltransferase YhbS